MTENNQVTPGADTKSFTVGYDPARQEARMIESTWVPGYTKAHTLTKREAIDWALRKIDEEEAALKVKKLAMIELSHLELGEDV
jgi:hypothetical protein